MVGLKEIGVYIARRQKMIAQYIATRPLMDLCMVAEQNTGVKISRQWWEQYNLDILGIRAGHAEAEGGGRRQGQKNWRERDIRVG